MATPGVSGAGLPKAIGRLTDLLKAFAERGKEASPSDCVELLGHLRKSREEAIASASRTGTPQRVLYNWHSECREHDGFKVLRERLLQQGQDGFSNLPNEALTRAYNLLGRMRMTREAEELWPSIIARISSGAIDKTPELLGLWRAAPAESLAAIDQPLKKALAAQDKLQPWALVGPFGRVFEKPQAQVLSWCTGEVAKRVPNLSSEDLASLVVFLNPPRREDKGGLPENMRRLSAAAKAELARRGGALPPDQLCALLPSIRGVDDKLWPLLRQKLGAYKEITPEQALEVCSFLSRLPQQDKAEEILYNSVTKHLRDNLARKATADIVAMLAKRLDIFAHDFETCQALLNASLRLPKNLYPAVLWQVFLAAADADLVGRHPELRNRLLSIGKHLETHKLRPISLTELRHIAEAMRKNQTALPKSAALMATRFIEVLGTTQAHCEGQELPREAEAEADSEAAGASDPPDPIQAAAAQKEPGSNLLGEVQELLIACWADLKLAGVDAPELAEAAQGFLREGGGCRIQAPALAQCIALLEPLAPESEEAVAIREGLVSHLVLQIKDLPLDVLVSTAHGGAPGSLRRAFTAEVERRFFESAEQDRLNPLATPAASHTSASSSSSPAGPPGVVAPAGLVAGDFNATLQILARLVEWSVAAHPGDEAAASALPGTASAVPPSLVRRLAALAVESLPAAMRKEPESAGRHLLATAAALSSIAVGQVPLAPLRRSLHEPRSPGPLALPSAAALAYQVASLHGGALPLDSAARLWKVLGEALPLGADEAAEEAIAGRCAAQLWAFGLATRHLCSPSTLNVLMLRPESPRLEACFSQLERKDRRARFELAKEPKAEVATAWLRGGLADALPLGEAVEERFAVPSTPYVVDVALTGQRLLLVAPRAAHRACGVASGSTINGAGIMMEGLLKALGWRLRWVWPEDGPHLAGDKSASLQAAQRLLGAAPPDPGPGSEPEPVAAAAEPPAPAPAAEPETVSGGLGGEGLKAAAVAP